MARQSVDGTQKQGAEAIIETYSPHWCMLAKPLAVFCGCVVIGVMVYVSPAVRDVFSKINYALPIPGGWRLWLTPLFPLVGAVDLWQAVATRRSMIFNVTNKHICIQTGIVSQAQIEMPINRINDISIEQSLCGRVFDYGTVIIEGNNRHCIRLEWLGAPNRLRRLLGMAVEMAIPSDWTST